MKNHPIIFVLLIDQSKSMSDHIQSNPKAPKKSEFIAEAVNKIFQALLVSASEDFGFRRYYQIGVIGYGSEVTKPLADLFPGQDLVWIDDLAANPLRIETREKKESDGAGGILTIEITFPVWIEPVANGISSMRAAFRHALDILENHLNQHPNPIPPTIINFTDGMANDGYLTEIKEDIDKFLAIHANANFFTMNVSSNPFAKSVKYPQTDTALTDRFAIDLFKMSTKIPSTMFCHWHSFHSCIKEGARGFVYNADIEELIALFDLHSESPLWAYF